MFQLENITLLPLLLLALLPVVLHILDRRRARTVVWPAIRFLFQADKRRLRRLRLLETLLILCRTVAILLIVLALVRPYRMEMTSRRDEPTGPRGAVLVFDTSLSMAYRHSSDGLSALERTQDNALRLLESFRPQDQVLVVTDMRVTDAGSNDSPPPELTAPEPTSAAADDSRLRSEIEFTRARVRSLTLSGRPFRLLDALERAADLAAPLTTRTREVFIFTDLTATTFDREDLTDGGLLRSRLSSVVKIHIVDCGATESRNHYLWRLETGPFANVSGQEAPLEVGVGLSVGPVKENSVDENPGTQTAAGTPLALRIYSGLEELSSHEVSPAVGGQTSLNARQSLIGSGETLLSARLPADGLSEDNVRYRVIQVDERIPVLALGTEPREIGSARFALLALSPAADELSTARMFEVDFVETLQNETLERYRLVVMCDPPTLDEASTRKIEEYVWLGGGLIFFAGPQLNLEDVNRLYRGMSGALPARLAPLDPEVTPRDVRPDGIRPYDIRPYDIDSEHAALRLFADPEQGDFQRIQIYGWRNVLEVAPDAAVLARLATVPTPTPWIVEKKYGEGTVVLVTTGATTTETSLPRTPLFLPLLHQFSRYVATDMRDEQNLTCGDPILLDLEAPATLRDAFVIDPEGKRHSLEVSVGNGGPQAAFGRTDRPGVYTVHWPSADGSVLRRVFAVNFPPTESHLERLTPEIVTRLKTALGADVSRDVDEVAALSLKVAAANHLWPPLVILALVCLFAELVLARMLARGRHR